MLSSANLLAQITGTSITPGNVGFPSPDPNRYGLPGSEVAITIVGGIIFYGLILTLVGLVLSAGIWAVGSFSNSYTQSVNGKRGFLICAACAVAIGGAYFMITWFFGAGQAVS